ncbi:MAG: dihydrofolate reductase family protein [Caulobacteraceae bacterium]|nr:dihydrofolate reductase family protein [Caulobacteraceae bacterium]
MARLIFGLQQSLDGFIGGADGEMTLPPPGPALFDYFHRWVSSLSASFYGRRTYELMRYWDEDQPGWGQAERDFAEGWRSQPKWVASRTLTSVGPNATLVRDDVEGVARDLKGRFEGEIEVAGPDLARSLSAAGLIDEYRLYFRPHVLGRGKPFFGQALPPLKLVSTDRIGEDAVRIVYRPA